MFQKSLALLDFIAFQIDGHHATEARHLPLVQIMLRMRFQRWIDHTFDVLMLGKVLGDAHGRCHVLSHSNGQRFNAAIDEIAVERRWNCTTVREKETFDV